MANHPTVIYGAPPNPDFSPTYGPNGGPFKTLDQISEELQVQVSRLEEASTRIMKLRLSLTNSNDEAVRAELDAILGLVILAKMEMK